MHFTALVLLALPVFAGEHQHKRSLRSHHRALDIAWPRSHARRRMQDAHPRLVARKNPLGPNDTTTEPSNIAPQTYTAEQGCTCWHSVLPGEVCLGLIDKSSAGFGIDQFYQYNPSVTGPNCGNLQEGLAYCVDNGPNGPAQTAGSTASTATGPVKSLNTKAQAAVVAQKTSPATTTSAPSPTSSAECSDDDDDNDSDGSDDLPYCDDNDDSSSSTSTSSSYTSTQTATNSPVNKLAQKTTSTSPATSTAQSTSSGGAISSILSQFSGVGTYFYQNGVAGACGTVHQDSALIVALYTSVYNGGSHCGQQVTLKNTANGNTVTATVADECPTCGGSDDIDCSVGVFSALSDDNLGLGVVNVEWGFANN